MYLHTSQVSMWGRGYIHQGIMRLRQTFMSILQCGIAAGGAYYLVKEVMGHEKPFFAPMAAIIVLSASGQGRTRRSMELVVGVAIGVWAGDFFVRTFGTGFWQMTIMVWLALIIATLLDRSHLVFTQAALGTVLIATIFPPGSGGGGERMFDALVGGLIGVITAALIPSSPLKGARMEVSGVLGLTAKVLDDVATGLENDDAVVINKALRQARGSQASINIMLNRVQEGQEQIWVSPLLWRQQRRLRSLRRILNPVDNAMRNTRVLARRAVLLTEDHDSVNPEQIRIIRELAQIVRNLSEVYTTNGDIEANVIIPESVKRLRELGAQQGLEVAAGKVLSAQVVYAQCRSITMDMLVICGLSRQSALATLKPTSEHPGVPSEVGNHAEHVIQAQVLDEDYVGRVDPEHPEYNIHNDFDD